MADTPKENQVKYTRYLNAFKTLAPAKTFSGVKLDTFQAQVNKSESAREKRQRLKDELLEAEAEIAGEDETTIKMCEKIKNGVVADEEFGDDSALYEALGYVRKSEKKSGLTRKKKDTEPPKE